MCSKAYLANLVCDMVVVTDFRKMALWIRAWCESHFEKSLPVFRT